VGNLELRNECCFQKKNVAGYGETTDEDSSTDTKLANFLPSSEKMELTNFTKWKKDINAQDQ
jgi:hypothetical protein